MDAKSIFAEALERSDLAERSAYLVQACGDNAELRGKVEALLRAYDEAGSFLDKPAAAPEATSDEVHGQWLNPDDLPETPLEGVGSRIRQYKLLQQIGEGGMGVVFMAEQQEPVRRMVAFKVIKAGMDSAQVIARFEQERQALALMDHPNIAKVLDAGTTASGRPFFVMELVKGIPMTRYCDEQRLSPKQRLELFVPVCQAIQHAHQKGIIHRDIKPSNVLIASYDGKPVPKVIDFGVAKATGQKLTERTLFTGLGGIVGTLEYMSPEQAELNALDIDTRSDVYSLGVLLYELLTGTTPLSGQRIKDAAFMEVLRLIREEEPPKPSTRLSESKDSLASVSAQRHSEPAALVKSMRGEVDWIVMKALDKDRTRRYETANGLARDIQRYLAEEPVEAGPPSARYRLRKLAWKHRRGLATTAALLLLLVTGTVVSTSLAVWAVRAENKAVDERNHARDAEADAKQQRDQAEAAHADAQAVLRFFQDHLLSAGRPERQEGGLGRQVKLRDAVDQAEKKIADSLLDRPLVESSIRDTLGTTYWYLGDYPQAIRQHERALALSESTLGLDHPNTLASRNNLANVYRHAGRFAEAIHLHEQTLRQREAILCADHPLTLQSRSNLANAYRDAGRTAEAVHLLEQALQQGEAKLGAEHPDTLVARNNLAEAYESAGRIADAIRLLEQALKQREARLGPEHPDTLGSRHNLANAYESAGRVADAICLLELTLKQKEAKLGAEHPDTLRSRSSLANAYWSAGRTAEAIRLHEQTLKQMEAKLGADHSDTLVSRNNLANAYHSAGRLADAIRLYEQNLKQQEARLGAEHPLTLTTRNNLAAAYHSAGRIDDAIRLHEQTLKQNEAKLGAEHPDTLTSRNNLAVTYLSAGRTAEAIPLFEQTLKQLEAKLGPDHPHTLTARYNLASAYMKASRTTQAVRLYEQNLKLQKSKLGPDDPRVASTLAQLALCLLADKKYEEAEPVLRDCLKIREAQQPNAWNTFNTRAQLGGALLGQKKYTDAEPLLRKGYQGMKQREDKIPRVGKPRLREALERLVQLYEATGKKDEADKWRRELSAAKAAGKK